MEMNVDTNHFKTSTICRICLAMKGAMQSLFVPDESIGQSVPLAEVLMSFANVQIREGDELPSLICLDCVHQVNRVLSFKQLCEQSDTNLRQNLIQQPITQVTIKQEEEVQTTDCSIFFDEFSMGESPCNSDEDDKDNKDVAPPTVPATPPGTRTNSSSNEIKLKRKSFTLQKKYEIIQQLQSGKKQSELCREMNLIKSTVCAIWKKRDEIVDSYKRSNSAAKRMRKSSLDELDRGLFKWFSETRAKNVIITGSLLQTKAEELGRSMLDGDFRCSCSWIERFKKRYGIKTGKIV